MTKVWLGLGIPHYFKNDVESLVREITDVISAVFSRPVETRFQMKILGAYENKEDRDCVVEIDLVYFNGEVPEAMNLAIVRGIEQIIAPKLAEGKHAIVQPYGAKALPGKHLRSSHHSHDITG